MITTGGDPTAILELVEPMATARGDHPDHGRVHGMTGASSLGIARRVAKEALGKVIGKHGRTITAMRMILHATRAQQDTRHALEVLDEARPLMGRQLRHRSALSVPSILFVKIEPSGCLGCRSSATG